MESPAGDQEGDSDLTNENSQVGPGTSGDNSAGGSATGGNSPVAGPVTGGAGSGGAADDPGFSSGGGPSAAGGMIGSGGGSTNSGGSGTEDPGDNPGAPDVEAILLASAEGAPSEAPPSGVPSNWSWVIGTSEHININPPGASYTHANFWGAIFRGESNVTPDNAMVEIRHCSFYILYEGEDEWTKMDAATSLGGASFTPQYFGGTADPPHLNLWDDGADVVPAPGNIWHFWQSNGYQPIRQNDVREVLSNCQTRLGLRNPQGPDDRAQADYLNHMGVDWRNPNDPSCSNDDYICPSFGVSKFFTIENYFRNNPFHSVNASDIASGVPLPPASIFEGAE